MEKIICVANRKGGVGKTTTAISLAAGVARGGFRTLLADLDLQCNATSGLGATPTDRHPLATGDPLINAIVPTSVERLDLLPGCRGFYDAELLAREDGPARNRMIEQLSSELDCYDYVLFDCPPSMGPLTRMALAWSTEALAGRKGSSFSEFSNEKDKNLFLSCYFKNRHPESVLFTWKERVRKTAFFFLLTSFFGKTGNKWNTSVV